MKGKTFYKVTNVDIYNKLVSIENKLSGHESAITWHTWALGVLLALILGIFSVK